MQLLRKIAFPISLIYALGVYLRNFCYDIGWFSSSRYHTPIICVGNLSVGGTGKTPMIEWLITQLKDHKSIAVLSRGYKRNTKGFIMAGPQNTFREIGDEPMQIVRKFPGVHVAVDANRRRGIQMLEEKVKPAIILLDDAFQHRKVIPSLNILLTSFDSLYCDDWYLPTGNLRDSKSAACRAHLIVVTKCPPDLSAEQQRQICRKLKPRPDQQILFASLVYDTLLKGQDQTMRLDKLKNTKINLVTGIARPEPLMRFLEESGINFNHLRFRDHHNFTKSDIASFNTKAFLLTTEKDYIRMANQVKNAYYLGVKHKFLGKDAEVIKEHLSQL